MGGLLSLCLVEGCMQASLFLAYKKCRQEGFWGGRGYSRACLPRMATKCCLARCGCGSNINPRIRECPSDGLGSEASGFWQVPARAGAKLRKLVVATTADGPMGASSTSALRADAQ